MVVLLSVPVLFGLLMLQTVVFRNILLLSGTADIVLLVLVAWALHERTKGVWQIALIAGFMVGVISALPFYIPMLAYLLIVVAARRLQAHIWQTPVLAMFFITVVGSFGYNTLSLITLQLSGTWLQWDEGLVQVILPGALLNLLLSLPVYALVFDFANWVFPVEAD